MHSVRLPNLAWLGIGWLAAAMFLASIHFLFPPSITVRWVTETEQNTAGFFITRSQSRAGPFLRLHHNPIPNQGDPFTGSSYQFKDRDVSPNTTYFYLLEEVELNGYITRYANNMQTYRTPGNSRLTVGATAVSTLTGLVLIAAGLMADRRQKEKT